MNSVVSQTFGDWELIVVDDGSEDSTGSICDSWVARDRRIHSVHIAHSGVSVARNAGMKMANGRWTVFLDSDDIYYPSAFEEMLANSEGMDLVTGSHCVMNQNKDILILPEKKIYSSITDTFQDMEQIYSSGFYHYVWGKLYRTNIIKSTFEQGVNYGEDFLFNSNVMAELRNICVLPSVIYGYRYRKFISCGQKINLSHLLIERRILEIWRKKLLTENEQQLAIVFKYYIRFIMNFFIKIIQIKTVSDQILKAVANKQLDTILVNEEDYGYRFLPEEYREYWRLIKMRDIDSIFDRSERKLQALQTSR